MTFLLAESLFIAVGYGICKEGPTSSAQIEKGAIPERHMNFEGTACGLKPRHARHAGNELDETWPMATKPKARGKATNKRKQFSKNARIYTVASARARLGAQRGEPQELYPASAAMLAPMGAVLARFRLTSTNGKQNALRTLSCNGLLRRVKKSARVVAQTVCHGLLAFWRARNARQIAPGPAASHAV